MSLELRTLSFSSVCSCGRKENGWMWWSWSRGSKWWSRWRLHRRSSHYLRSCSTGRPHRSCWCPLLEVSWNQQKLSQFCYVLHHSVNVLLSVPPKCHRSAIYSTKVSMFCNVQLSIQPKCQSSAICSTKVSMFCNVQLSIQPKCQCSAICSTRVSMFCNVQLSVPPKCQCSVMFSYLFNQSVNVLLSVPPKCHSKFALRVSVGHSLCQLKVIFYEVSFRVNINFNYFGDVPGKWRWEDNTIINQ